MINAIFGWVGGLQGIPVIIFWVISVLSGISAVVFFRGFYFAVELGKIAQTIEKRGKRTEPLDILKFKTSQPYKHLWSEYKDTLHSLKLKDGGQECRATLPAEAFFSKEVLVDNRVWNDFFRHLPGILTGLGIIGTFAGLITGLEGFSPSEDAGSARQSLATLLQGVQEAFHLSAFAISCAIAATFLEKWSLTWAYKNVEKMTHAIDSLYEAGAGEEYLSRLVEADEANAAQTAQLKDSLVNDLKTLLSELTERQIEAQKASSLELGHVIRGSLGEVNASVSELNNTFVGKASADTDNIKGALDSLIAGFIERLNATLGEQMQTIQLSMQQSSHTMQQVEQSLNTLVSNIAKTTHGVMEDVMHKMENTMQTAAANQELLTQQMGEFVNQLRAQMESQQASSHETMQKMLASMLTAIASNQEQATETIKKNVEEIGKNQQEQHNRLAANVEELLKQVGSAVNIMQTNITELRRTTTDAISGMNSGANRMKAAADQFSTAGQSVSGVLEKATPLATQMATSSNVLGQASQQLANSLAQYQQLRNETLRNIEILQQLINTAKQEAGIKKDLISDIQRVATTLSNTEKQSVEYLDNINQVLSKSFQAFGDAMKNQISQNIKQTDTHLSSGMNQLTGVIQELGAQLQRMRNRG